jgi:hypothetical protein
MSSHRDGSRNLYLENRRDFTENVTQKHHKLHRHRLLNECELLNGCE